MFFENGVTLVERDFLMRVIRELFRALADLAGSKQEQVETSGLLDAVQEAQRSLDVDPLVVQLLSRSALVRLAEAKGHLEPLGLLLWAEAGIRRELGDEAMAAKLRRRSLALLHAARAARLPLSEETEEILARR